MKRRKSIIQIFIIEVVDIGGGQGRIVSYILVRIGQGDGLAEFVHTLFKYILPVMLLEEGQAARIAPEVLFFRGIELVQRNGKPLGHPPRPTTMRVEELMVLAVHLEDPLPHYGIHQFP